jgi:hypothetical protein
MRTTTCSPIRSSTSCASTEQLVAGGQRHAHQPRPRSLGGYAFARLRFPGRELLFLLVLATLMIPDQLRLVPVFQMLSNFPLFHWNLINTYQGYILISVVTAVTCS